MNKPLRKNSLVHKEKPSEDKFLSIFENSLNAILFGMPDGTLLDANSAAAGMFGYTVEELIALGRGLIFDMNDSKMIASLKIREKTGKAKGELIGIRKNGERFPCEFSSAIFKTESGESRTSTVLNDITERRKAEVEMTLLMDNTEESFVLIDRNLNIISFNKQFSDKYKVFFGKEIVKGDCILDFAQDDRKEVVKTTYKRVFNGEIVEDEIEIPINDNELIIIAISYKPAVDKSGNVIGAFITSRDITENRKTQLQIISIEKRFRSIIEYAGDLITLTDVNGNIIYISPSVEKIIGFNASEIINKACEFIIHPDYLEESKLLFEELLSKPGIPIPRLIKILHKDGHFIWVEGVVTNLLQDENVKAIVSNYRDITEKIAINKQKEFEKRDKEALINSTDDLIWSVSRDFKLFAGNKAFINLLKSAAGIALVPGDNVLEVGFFSDEVIAFWKTLYEKAFNGIPVKQEIYTPEFENTPRSWTELNINPIYDADQIIGVACYSRNITEKKITQLKLNEKNDLFEKLTSKIPAAIYQFEINSEGKMYFPYISKGIEKINPNLNIDLLKEDASSAFTSIHPEDLGKLLLSIEVSKNDLTDWELEYRTVSDKGKINWTKGSSRPEKKPDGTTVWYGYLEDITEQKNNNEKIRISKERYDIIAKATNDTIWDRDLITNEVKWNKGISGIFGYKNDEPDMDADWWFSKIHPEDVDLVRKNLESHLIKNDKRWENEYRFLCANGTYRHVNDRGFIVVNESSIPIRMMGAMQDITERKKEEYHLKLLESVITNTNDAVVISEVESNGEPGPRIVYVNNAFTKMTGYSDKEIIGKTPIILLGSKSDENELKRLSKAMKKFERCEITIINYKKNGEEFWVEMAVSPVTDEMGKITHWISIERDITQRKFYELEREQIIAEISQTNKDLKQFSYVTSHNLRAPIANLLGLSSLIDRYKIPNKSLKQILDGIKQSALMFDETVKDLSQVLIIKDQTNVTKEELSLVSIVDKSLAQLSITVHDSEVKINYEFKRAPTVAFTSSYLESIFINLFTNALKYRSHQRKLKIEISSEDTKEYVVVKFKDNGIGIDVELHREKLFKLYQRFHENTDGRGLGLYLIKSQMDALGGTIDVESTVGKGTVFILKFKKNIKGIDKLN